MKPPTSVFQLGRMRHIDLLALWHYLHPDSHDRNAQLAGRMPPRLLIDAILASAPKT